MKNSPHEPAVLRAVAEAIRTHVRRAFDALSARLREVADDVQKLREELASQPKSVVTADDVLPELKKHLEFLVMGMPAPRDGASVTVEDVTPLVEATVNRYLLGLEPRVHQDTQRAIEAVVQRMPAPVDGKDADPAAVAERLRDDVLARATAAAVEAASQVAPKEPSAEQIARAVEHYMTANPVEVPVPRDGVDGKDAEPVADAAVYEAVKRYMIENPVRSVTVEDVVPLLEAKAAQYALDLERRAYDILHGAIEKIPAPVNGKDADPAAVAALIIDQLDLKSSTRASVTKLCQELVAAEVGKLPVPKDGQDAPPVSAKDIADAVAQYMVANPLPVPRDGKDAEPINEKDISDAVARYMSANPPRDGVDGQSVDIKDIEQLVEQRAALWGLDFERRAQGILQNAIERLPAPKDGRDGVDGKDGFTAKDLSIDFDPESRLLRYTFKTAEGDRTVEHKLRMPIYREIWKEGTSYELDDMVTYAGSLWIALKDTTSRPGSGDWRLCVKSPRGPRNDV